MSESRRTSNLDHGAVSELLARFDSLHGLREMGVEERSRFLQAAHAVLDDRKLKRDEGLRFRAVNLIVAMLPETFEELENVMRDFSSPLWYEVHFSAIVCLDRDELGKSDQTRVEEMLERYLMTVRSRAGFAAWKAGDHLGDEWFSPDTVQALERALLKAPYAAGRLGALHGIEHAINNADPAQRKRLFRLLRKVSRSDRSEKVRWRAKSALKGGGCVRMPPP